MAENKKQFDLQGLISNIKTMINPTANTPDPNPEDVVGIKLAELSVMVQQLQQAYAEQGKVLGKVNKLFNEVYQSLEAFHQKENEPAAEAEEKPVSEQPKEDDKSEK